ncbi:MAG: adenosylcobinamide-phosphate synthase CbiB [Clostridiales bacterium]|nr:adenosylcobinamide-phosphate synthase CbiB [Eubacteriales bacterium]MDH7565741.1 adenosylcobinamide-phosphate synthase CbiB [Clostridiales bacterium]
MTAFLLADVLIAYTIDILIGDPYWMPHPVRFIGWLISKTEKGLRSLAEKDLEVPGADKAQVERRAGAILAFFVITVTFLLVGAIVWAAYLVSPILFHIANIYFIYSALATKCLGDEAGKVYDVLVKKDITAARERLAMLVGRQTDGLDEKEIIRGVVETTAENTTDGIISPLFYALIGSLFGMGAPLVYAFKAISTLDSMVGYMNEKYMNFGRVSAKIDDAANYLPARFTGLIIPVAAFFCGKNMKRSFYIMRRDRRNHKSPNCAYAEAAVAGALGIKIGGTNVYFGQVVEKPTIGDPDKELEPADIKDTVRLMYVASLLSLVVLGAAAAGVAGGLR